MNTIRKLAEQKPELRKHLAPILKQAQGTPKGTFKNAVERAKLDTAHSFVEEARSEIYYEMFKYAKKVTGIGDGTYHLSDLKHTWETPRSGIPITSIDVQWGISFVGPPEKPNYTFTYLDNTRHETHAFYGNLDMTNMTYSKVSNTVIRDFKKIAAKLIQK